MMIIKKTWFSQLKQKILIDETQSVEKVTSQYKARINWFIGLIWLYSMVLIWVIPDGIMQYDLAKHFVSIMGNVVPMIDGLEQIRLHGSEDPYKSHLIVLPQISFFYAVLWLIGLICIPYMLWLIKGNFIYNKDSNLIGIKGSIELYKKRYFVYYFRLIMVILVFCFILIQSDSSRAWFVTRYVHTVSSGFMGGLLSIGMVFLLIMTFYTHILMKQFKGEIK